MHTKLFLSSLVLAGLATGSIAQESKPLGLAIRGGIFMPTSSIGRDEGNNWFAFGADYRVKEARMGNMASRETAHWAISVDFHGKGDISSIPILLNYVVHNREIFYSFGAGVSFDRDYTIVGAARSKRNRVGGGFQAGIGYEFQKGTTPFFVEGKYFFHTNSGSNGLGVFAGIRL